MKVLTTNRCEGKSAELLAWLLDGEPIDKWPAWSRVIVVASTREALYLAHSHPDSRKTDEALRSRGGVTLSKLVLPIQGGAVTRRSSLLDRVEIAVDNADHLIRDLLNGASPAFVTLTGEVVQVGSEG